MVGTLLFIDDLLSFYNGIPLRYCLDNESDLKTYPDISQAASDTSRRIFVSVKGCLSLIIILYIILLVILFGYECFRCFINHKTNLNSANE
ncbi:BnaC04g19880D [Brassica napus]|uniref:BnaC04g19870D protein n=2 Tax=Brassica TaxID=3705 RepID=A0A078FA50_BRANA|nr:unnamed protein product [Brassica napus]CDY08678.1 BnaC04g19870D [Brassica napus]CDY08679.1 BnaC04g19880D [Brassica napus]